MHDFCFTIPYGLVLVVGGIVGYAKKGSLASLGGGLGTGLVLILAGYLSLKAFEKRKNSYLALILETGMVLVPLNSQQFFFFLFFLLNLDSDVIFWGDGGVRRSRLRLFMIVILLGNFGMSFSLVSLD